MENTTQNPGFWLSDGVFGKFYVLLYLDSINIPCGEALDLRHSISSTDGMMVLPRIFYISLLEWVMSNSQRSGTAGEMQIYHRGEDPSGVWGPHLPQGPKEMETQKWHLPFLWRSLMVLYIYLWFSLSFLSAQLSHCLSAVQMAAEGTGHDCWKSGDWSVFFKDDATSLGYPSCSYAYKTLAISEVLTTTPIIKIPDICIKH